MPTNGQPPAPPFDIESGVHASGAPLPTVSLGDGARHYYGAPGRGWVKGKSVGNDLAAATIFAALDAWTLVPNRDPARLREIEEAVDEAHTFLDDMGADGDALAGLLTVADGHLTRSVPRLVAALAARTAPSRLRQT